jgi:hypothetical protein
MHSSSSPILFTGSRLALVQSSNSTYTFCEPVFATGSLQTIASGNLPSIGSQIISAVPEIFSIWRRNKLRFLYRGSRDGFEASAFHNRCNGHANTITLISSTNDCIFGGSTPIA